MRIAYCRQHFNLLLMTNMTLALLLAATLGATAAGHAQQVTLTVRQAPLTTVLKQIETQTGYSIIYRDEWMREARPVDLSLTNAPLEEALNACFRNQPFDWALVDQLIVVKRKPASAPLTNAPPVHTPITAPPIDVHGRITLENGDPAEGATITVKGTRNSTTCDANGAFTLKAVPSDATLTVSFVGYTTSEISIKGRTAITFKLQIESTSLNDVVVHKGYYDVKQRYNTGNVTRVDGKDIQKQPVTDPLLALEGRVPGLYIQQTSGLPGSYSTILLRGQNSIPSELKPATLNDPLFIVDGVPFSSETLTNSKMGGGSLGTPAAGFGNDGSGRGQGLSPFNLLNPADIESIEVLKDADATAIYGSRGSNGVILITTKKGKAGKTKMELNVYSGYSKPASQFKLLNTQQYLEMRREAFKNDQAMFQSSFPSFVWVPNPNRDYDLTFWDTTRYTDWQKVLLGRNAHFSNAQLSISGGNTNTQFMINGGYSKQGAVFPGDYADIVVSGHFSLIHSSFNQKFHLQLSAGYSGDKNNLPTTDLSGSIFLPPNAPALYDASGNLNWEPKNGKSTWANPLAQIYNQSNSFARGLNSNMVLSYQLYKGLQLSSSVGYNYSQINQSLLNFGDHLPPETIGYANYSRSNNFAFGDRTTWIAEPQINYHHQWGDLKFDALAGSTFQERKQSGVSQIVSDFPSDALVSNPGAGVNFEKPRYFFTQYKYNAFYGRFGFNWRDKYLLNLTARRDGSSHFGPGKQFGNFGAIGAGWIFSSEKFINDKLAWLSFGKLRVSYGITGNDNLTDYQYLSSYSINNQTYQESITLSPTQLTNPYYAWEENRKFEVGLDLGLFKDRLTTNVSYYRNRTGNQLVGYPLPYIAGYTSVQYNLPAIIQNTGIELTIRGEIIKNVNFDWSSSFNTSFPKNKLVAYPSLETSSYKDQYVIGQSLFIKRTFHYLGVDPQNGNYTYVTKSGTGKPDFGVDYTSISSVAQKFYAGWENTFSYKGIQFDVMFQLVKQTGRNIFSSNGSKIPGSMYNQPVEVLQRWQKPGDQSNFEQFTVGNGPANDAFRIIGESDAGYTDASFARLKNLAISYQLPKSWISKAHIEGCRIYFQGQNLLTITNFKGADPETQGLSLPPMKVFTMGASLSF